MSIRSSHNHPAAWRKPWGQHPRTSALWVPGPGVYSMKLTSAFPASPRGRSLLPGAAWCLTALLLSLPRRLPLRPAVVTWWGQGRVCVACGWV